MKQDIQNLDGTLNYIPRKGVSETNNWIIASASITVVESVREKERKSSGKKEPWWKRIRKVRY